MQLQHYRENNTAETGFRSRYFGDRQFYKKMLLIAVPIMVQNGITNFVSMLDNIMIGRIGTEQMSGASIVNQLIFVYNLCIFGAVSGAGIFTAQYFGLGDHEGVRMTFRFKLILSFILTAAASLLFIFYGDPLISLYLQGGGEASQAAATLGYGRTYLRIMLIGLPVFMISNAYTSTLRECGETILPMNAGIIAVFVNLIFNYLMIYGKFGFPKLGIAGAAIATVISRVVELLVVVVHTHTHVKKLRIFSGVYRTLKVPADSAKRIIVKGAPLLINETLWAAGMAMLTQCYSVRGLNVVAALNISSTISNVFNVIMIAMGSAVAIIIGQLLGAGQIEEAVSTDRKLIMFSVLSCTGTGILMMIAAPYFPNIYNTSNDVKHLAVWLIILTAAAMPHNSFLNSAYFTLRSGGKTIITFLFDSVFIWVFSVPAAFILTRFTYLNILAVYAFVLALDLVKCLIGYILLKKRVWINTLV